MPSPHRSLLIASLAVLAACTNDPVTPDPVITASLSATEAWAGDSIRLMLRGGEGQAPIPTVRVGAAALTVTRHDDTTFRVVLPPTSGAVTLQVEQTDGTLSSHDVTLHGFVGPVFRPSIEGKLLHVPGGPPTHFFGGMIDGLVQVDVATGLPIRKWGDSTHSLLCSNVVGPGWETGDVILRGKDAGGNCGGSHVWQPAGDAIVRKVSLGTPPSDRFPVAFVRSNLLIQGSSSNAAWFSCLSQTPPCAIPTTDPASTAMWSVGVSQARKRLVTHASNGAIYDLNTGAVVYSFGRRDGDPRMMKLVGSTFTEGGNAIYLLGRSTTGGAVFRLNDPGMLFDSIVTPRVPRALAVDPARGLLHVAEFVPATQKMELRVYKISTLEPVTVQPMDAATGAAFAQMDFFEVVIDEADDKLYIVGTFMSSVSPINRFPAVIAKFSLPGS